MKQNSSVVSVKAHLPQIILTIGVISYGVLSSVGLAVFMLFVSFGHLMEFFRANEQEGHSALLFMLFVGCCLVAISLTVSFYLLKSFRKVFLRLSLSISVSRDIIEISNSQKEYHIKALDIIHILGRNNFMMLVWERDGTPVTFNISLSLFGAHGFRALYNELSEWESFVDDEKKIVEIRKNLKLDDIFKKNNFKLDLN